MNNCKINLKKQKIGLILMLFYFLCSSLNIFFIPPYNIPFSKTYASVNKSYTICTNSSKLNFIRLFDKSILDDDHFSSNKFSAKVILLVFGSLVILFFSIEFILPELYLFFNKQCVYLIFLCFRIWYLVNKLGNASDYN